MSDLEMKDTSDELVSSDQNEGNFSETNDTSEKDVETSSSEGDSEASHETAEESEKIVLTKEERDAEAARIREIAERRGRREAQRELEAKYQQEFQKLQQQPYSQQYSQQYLQQNMPPQPSANHIWDQSINQWIDPVNMTVNDYLNLAQQSMSNPQGYQAQMQPTQQMQQVAPKTPTFTKSAEDQGDECMVSISDFETVMKGAPITPDMANSACIDSNGMKNLYRMMKDAPHELYKISKLSPQEQQHRMWLMNRKFADEKAKKLQSKATPQAAPLKNNGEINKPESELSLSELKQKRLAEKWGD